MPKLLFTQTRKVAQGDGRGAVYEAGKVYDLPARSCEHWKARGVAVDAPPPSAKVEAPLAAGKPDLDAPTDVRRRHSVRAGVRTEPDAGDL
jgi:hypothetical protein